MGKKEMQVVPISLQEKSVEALNCLIAGELENIKESEHEGFKLVSLEFAVDPDPAGDDFYSCTMEVLELSRSNMVAVHIPKK